MRESHSCKRDLELYRKVKEAISMRQVVEYYGIKVDEKGWCICPFHQDRHPSMKIFPDGRGYYCFTCGSGGDQITFAARYLGVRNSEAARYLAEMFRVPLEEPSTYREKRQAEFKRREHQDMEVFTKRAKLYLRMYRNLLCEARRDPGSCHFLEGIYKLEYIEYLLECTEHCPEEMYGNQEAVKKIGEVEGRVIGWYDQTGKNRAVS